MDRNAILALPFGCRGLHDHFIWPFTMDGRFSVKSGYYWLMGSRSPSLPRTIGSSHYVDPLVWKTIWSCHTLPKIKFFLWRAVAGLLPTFATLFKRKLRLSPICPFCNEFCI